MRSTFNLFKTTAFLRESSPFTHPSLNPSQRTTSDHQISGLQCQLAPRTYTPSSPFTAAQLPLALEGLDRHLNPSTPPRRSPCSSSRGLEPFPRSVHAAAPWLATGKKNEPALVGVEGDPLPAARLWANLASYQADTRMWVPPIPSWPWPYPVAYPPALPPYSLTLSEPNPRFNHQLIPNYLTYLGPTSHNWTQALSLSLKKGLSLMSNSHSHQNNHNSLFLVSFFSIVNPNSH